MKLLKNLLKVLLGAIGIAWILFLCGGPFFPEEILTFWFISSIVTLVVLATLRMTYPDLGDRIDNFFKIKP